jgi:hypothetical protein
MMTRRDFMAAAGAAPAMAQMPSAEEGFTSLFDGRSLRGWNIIDGPESAFYVNDSAILVHEGSGFPTWLRSERQYENFDFRGEFFIRGWMDSGIYFHAPEHGRPMWNGMELHLFHNNEEKPEVNSMGAILPVVPPLKINVRNKGEWNAFRILMDWPRLQVWTNGEIVQDLDVERIPELRYRFRRGYLGLQSLAYPIRFRNLRVRELPDKERWQPLYETPADMAKWHISEGKPKIDPLGEVLRGDGAGHIATNEKFRDFELQLFVRHAWQHNGGVLFRTSGQGSGGARHYEIQLHDVEGAHFPTGSLYHLKRATYPRIEAEKWWPMRLLVKDRYCMVRINGDTVLEYDKLDNLEEGPIELQTHAPGRWTEFKHIRVKRI